MSGALEELIRSADPALSPYALADPPIGRWEARLDDPRRAFVLEAVYEGFLLHYGKPRAFGGMDRDMSLLAGDALYALGLERLAAAGDLRAVAELADLISLSARAQAEAQTAIVGELWEASARALSGAGGPGARATMASRGGADGLPRLS